MVHGVGVKPVLQPCLGCVQSLCQVERAAFFGSRVWLALETAQFDFAEPDLAGNWRC